MGLSAHCLVKPLLAIILKVHATLVKNQWASFVSDESLSFFAIRRSTLRPVHEEALTSRILLAHCNNLLIGVFAPF